MGDYIIQSGDTPLDITTSTNGVAIYNITVDVIRNGLTNTALGCTETPSTVVDDMPCDIKWKSGSKKITFNKKTYYVDAILNCRKPTGVTILTSDIIQYDGVNYKIAFINNVNNLGVLLQIALERIK